MVPPFFPSLNWAMSSTVLLVIINLVGRYGGEEKERSKGEMKSLKLVYNMEGTLRSCLFVQKYKREG